VIQGYWGAIVRSIGNKTGESPEERIKKSGHVNICDIVIDGKLWEVMWNGKELSLRKATNRSVDAYLAIVERIERNGEQK
jgi:hypothetical protein